MDIIYSYGPGGMLMTEDFDLDFDGKFDERVYYQEGKKVRMERDMNGDASPTTWNSTKAGSWFASSVTATVTANPTNGSTTRMVVSTASGQTRPDQAGPTSGNAILKRPRRPGSTRGGRHGSCGQRRDSRKPRSCGWRRGW